MAIKKENKFVRDSSFIFLIIVLFIASTTVSALNLASFFSIWKAISLQIIFLLMGVIMYSIKDFQKDFIGMPIINIGKSFIFGTMLGIVYLFVVSLFPGLSIGQILLPQTIADSFQGLLITVIAPLSETIFFLGILLGFVSSKLGKKRLWLALLIVSFFFAIFHTGAYIQNWVQLPSFSEGFLGFSSNISVFISAFLFMMVSGWLVTRKKIKNLMAGIMLHVVPNVVSWFGNYAIIG